MCYTETETKKNILKVAKKEFLEKGFLNASLRNIVKMAGVTTGAFYGYYSNKEALFTALVEPHAVAVMGKFMQAQDHFSHLPDIEQPKNMGVESGNCIEWTIDYVYDHFDEFKLIICCSEGTPYQNFIHKMVEVEVESTYKYIDTLRRLGKKVPKIDHQLCHIICSGMFSSIFEVVVHNMPKEEAKDYVKTLKTFYEAGWLKIMGQ